MLSSVDSGHPIQMFKFLQRLDEKKNCEYHFPSLLNMDVDEFWIAVVEKGSRRPSKQSDDIWQGKKEEKAAKFLFKMTFAYS